jgi:hypothetical protein
MNWIVVDGVRPWDGRYEFDLDEQPLTSREWGWIKRHAGYLPLTIDDGLRGGDPELFSIWAVIALRRAGKIQPAEVAGVFERFADAPFDGSITFEGGEVGADAGPPPSETGANGSSSGAGSTTSSETSAATPPPAGTPDWATSESAPAMSVS